MGFYTLNDEDREFDNAQAPSISDVVESHTGDRAPAGVAVAVNASVVPASAWDSTRVASGDRIDILVAVQGG